MPTYAIPEETETRYSTRSWQAISSFHNATACSALVCEQEQGVAPSEAAGQDGSRISYYSLHSFYFLASSNRGRSLAGSHSFARQHVTLALPLILGTIHCRISGTTASLYNPFLRGRTPGFPSRVTIVSIASLTRLGLKFGPNIQASTPPLPNRVTWNRAIN